MGGPEIRGFRSGTN